MKLRIDARVAIAIGAAAAIAILSRPKRRRGGTEGAASEDAFETSFPIDAAPLIVVRGARAAITIGPTDDEHAEVRSPGARELADAVDVSREDDGACLILDVRPRSALQIFVPKGSALRIEVARSAVRVTGVSDVDVHCTRSSVTLLDVAGAVAVDSARGAVKVDLAHDRRTRSVDVSATRSALFLVLPPDRGGSYDVRAARSSIVHPPPVADGIPFVVQAARASVAIRAA
jgi:hypothetical protein